jgi:hypothetical protein
VSHDPKAESTGENEEEFRLGFHLIEIKRWTTARALFAVKLFDKKLSNWREYVHACMGFVQLTGLIRPTNLPPVRLFILLVICE